MKTYWIWSLIRLSCVLRWKAGIRLKKSLIRKGGRSTRWFRRFFISIRIWTSRTAWMSSRKISQMFCSCLRSRWRTSPPRKSRSLKENLWSNKIQVTFKIRSVSSELITRRNQWLSCLSGIPHRTWSLKNKVQTTKFCTNWSHRALMLEDKWW